MEMKVNHDFLRREQGLNPELELNPEVGFGEEVIQALNFLGQEAYIAGGFCRDLLLGSVPKDVDIATSAKPEQLLHLEIPGVQFKLIDASEAYPVVQAIKEEMSLEIATFRKDEYENGGGDSRRPDTINLDATLVDDAFRRDLTVNALYFNPLTNEVIDPTGQGIRDIEDKVIRFVGNSEARIGEDRIRILRAVRFKNKLGFDYAPETRQALQEAGEELLRIKAKDRVRTELTKILLPANRAEALQDLDDLGMLEILLPEFSAGKGVEQPAEHHSEGDVFAHQLMVMSNLPEKPSGQLVWAALLHDIGKPHTQTFDEDGRIRFNGHDEFGEVLARKVMQRMVSSNEDTEAIAWLVRQHMVVRNLSEMKRSKQLKIIQPHLTNPGIKREELFQDLLDLLKADNASSLRPDGSTDQISLRQAEEIQAGILEELASQKPTVKEQFGIDGKRLIEYLQIEPASPQLKSLSKLITYLNESFQDQPTLTEGEILGLADSWWQCYS